MPTYSLVIPVFNEEETLPELARRLSELMERLDGDCEVILVDDGSRDRSFDIMTDIHSSDERFKLIRFSRNFGHQVAISAGMDFASGQAIIIMDADLQDPPEVVLEMTRHWRAGSDVVYGVRKERLGETWFKKTTAAMFYRLLRKFTGMDIPVDTGDFRLVDRKALDAFKSLREHNRYVRGMFTWVGFKQTGVKYLRSERFAGSTKYPLSKMLKLALDGILSFSFAPLRFILTGGIFITLASIVVGLCAIVTALFRHPILPSLGIMTVILAFFTGIQLIVVGILGEYIGRIYEDVRNRPLYIVHDTVGLKDESKVHIPKN
ncbi:MAG: glycosyltransferase family 2 protein [Armatimonadota bacterium]